MNLELRNNHHNSIFKKMNQPNLVAKAVKKKKKIKIKPPPPSSRLLLGFAKQAKQAASLKTPTSAVVPSAQSSLPSVTSAISPIHACTFTAKKNFILQEAWRGITSGRGRPKVVSKDTSGDCNATVFQGALYAGVAHSLFNHVYEKKNNLGKTVPFKIDILKESIWDLSKKDEALRAQRTVIRRTRQQEENAFNGKRAKTSYKSWSRNERCLAVDKLLAAIPEEHRTCSRYWRGLVTDHVARLKLESDVWKDLTHSHLCSWYEKFFNQASILDWNFQASYCVLNDARTENGKNSMLIPHELREKVKEYLMGIIAAKIEVNTTILRPFLRRFIENVDGGRYRYLFDPPKGRKFTLSKSWLNELLLESKLRYRAVTNDAGKLPDSWESDKEDFLIRASYLAWKYHVPPELMLNMDETPLAWLATFGKTWAAKGATNVHVQGGKDKRQATGTPWMNANGELAFFHVTVKGKTDRCLPKAEFRNQPRFQKFQFGYSENHWVSKETMRAQVTAAEEYRTKVIEENDSLNEDQKMIIVWDVYVRHRDPDLLLWIKETYPHIIILFVPANLTELCQPLDIYFNGEFKMVLANLRSTRIAELYEEWNESVTNMTEEEKEENSPSFKVPTSISDTKELFYNTLAGAIEHMQTNEKKERLKTKAFADLQKCYDPNFQTTAVEKVLQDRTNRYFKFTGNDLPVDVAVQRFAASEVHDVIVAHEDEPTREDFENSYEPKYFLKREVRPLDGKYPGRVEAHQQRRGDYTPATRGVFTVRYYRDIIGNGRAARVMKYTRGELIPLLLVREEAEVREENLEESIEVESDAESDGDAENDEEDMDCSSDVEVESDEDDMVEDN